MREIKKSVNPREMLLIGKTKTCPEIENGNDDDFVAIYTYENDFSEIEKAEENGNCEYLILIMQKTNSDKLPSLEKVNSEWNELFGGAISDLEFITDDRRLIKKSFREMLDEGPYETIQFKLPVVGYIANSTIGKNEAKKLLKSASLKKKWEIWK